MSIKESIGWTDKTWNPIKGVCPVQCKLPDGRVYCYGDKNYRRFHRNPEIRPSEEYPEIIPMQMYDHKGKIISRRVFVCSTFELFHPSVKKEWRDWIFNNIKYNYHLTFQILTKFPQNIDRKMPENVWLGITITHVWDYPRLFFLKRIEAKLKFISFEPLLYDGEYPLTERMAKDVNWAIVGKLTQHGKKYNPKKEQIEKFIRFGKHFNIPIFLKDNLRSIWGEPLIQEFPKETS